MKQFITITLCLLLLPTFPAAVLAQETPLILEKQDYTAYSDVSQEDWYYAYARLCQETQLIPGQDGMFRGAQALSKEEAVAIVVRLQQAYWGEAILQDMAGDDWFAPYLRYALEQNILTEEDYRNAAGNERIFFFSLLTRAIHEDTLVPINTIYDIPDLDTTSSLGQFALLFYQYGILTGADSFGNFEPNRPITRAEAAAILSRLIRADLRVTFTLTPIPGQDAWKALVQEVKLAQHPDDRIWFDGTYIYCDNDALGNLTVMDDSGKPLFSLDGHQYIGIEYAGDGIFRATRSEYPTVQYFTEQGVPASGQCYANGTNYENGTALVQQGEEPDVVQLIDTAGAVVKSFDLGVSGSFAFQLVEDAVLFPYLSTNEIGILNVKTGDFLLRPYVAEVPPNFTEGLIGVQALPGEWGSPYGFMNTKGALAVPMKYHYVTPFQHGYASVFRIEDDVTTYALIDTEGTEVLSSAQWNYESPNSKGLLLATEMPEEEGAEPTRTVLMNLNGDILLELPAEHPSFFELYNTYIVRYSTDNATPSGIFTLAGEDALAGVRMEAVIPHPQRCLLKIQGNYYFFDANVSEAGDA